MMTEKEINELIEFKEGMLHTSKNLIMQEMMRGHISLLKLVRDGGIENKLKQKSSQ